MQKYKSPPHRKFQLSSPTAILMAQKCRIKAYAASLIGVNILVLRFCVDAQGKDVVVHVEDSETEDHDRENESEDEQATDSA